MEIQEILLEYQTILHLAAAVEAQEMLILLLMVH
jgi:hypothetical protein